MISPYASLHRCELQQGIIDVNQPHNLLLLLAKNLKNYVVISKSLFLMYVDDNNKTIGRNKNAEEQSGFVNLDSILKIACAHFP